MYWNKKTKIILLVSFILILSLGLSLIIFLFKTQNSISRVNLSSSTTTSTKYLSSVTIPLPLTNIGLRKEAVLNRDMSVSYEIVGKNIITDSLNSKIEYEIELKSNKEIVFNASQIESIVNFLIQDLKEREKSNKTNELSQEIDFAFFSDRGLINNKPFDIAYAMWLPDTNEIRVFLQK